MAELPIGCSICPATLGSSLRAAIETDTNPHEAAAREVAEASERELLLALGAGR